MDNPYQVKISLTWALCALSAIVAATALAQAPKTTGTPIHNINLIEARDIADAAAVDAAISVMVKDAASCNSVTSKDPQGCVCSFKGHLKKLKSAYDSAVAKHAGWNEPNTVVAYVDPVNRKSVALNLPGVKRQLDTCEGHKR